MDDLAAIPWFADLEAPVRAALADHGRLQRRKAGEWVYGEGDEDTGVVAVLEGGLHLYAQAPGGREVLFFVLPKGGVTGQSIRFGGGPRLLTAVCAVDSLLFLLSDRALRQVADTHPVLWPNLAALAYGQQRVLIETIVELVALKPRQRMIARLLALSSYTPAVPATQSALAEMIGVSRKAVNGWLGELDQAGRIARGYGQIEVIDRPGLERMLRAQA
jgi:CRP-like cAMP-binding protein